MTTSYQNQKYTELPVADAPPVSPSSGRRNNITSLALVFFGAIILGSVVLLVSPNSSNKSEAYTLDNVGLEGASKPSTRACTFKECVAAGCNHEVAPFTCLFHNGGPHGGCSAVPWNEWSCTESCDLTGCDSLDFPDDVVGCESVPCSKEWCTIGQLCGPDVPYQCLEGAGRFGCSDDAFHWTLYGCKCCDASTCS